MYKKDTKWGSSKVRSPPEVRLRLFQFCSGPMQKENPAGTILEIWQSETEGSFYVSILL